MSARVALGENPEVTLGHRRLFARLAAVLALLLVVLVLRDGSAQSYSPDAAQLHFSVSTPTGRQRVIATVIRRADGKPFDSTHLTPVVVALHGRGESLRGPERGYLGWNVDYLLPQAFAGFRRGHLTQHDYRGYVTESHLAWVNAALRAQPYRGILIVTPFTPDFASELVQSEKVRAFTDWLATGLLRQVKGQFPEVSIERESVGIDGVSLGGRLALEAGFTHPEAFGVVGAMQPAIERDGDAIAKLRAADALPQAIRLLTSDADPYRDATRRFSTSLRSSRISHSLIELPGPHNAGFNRGPGAVELIRFHDAALRHPVRTR